MTSLIIPIHLDALYLKKAQVVNGPKADFSRLPYVNKSTGLDVNSDISNISENFISQPFQNSKLSLDAGIHLHWALPDCLSEGSHESQHDKASIKYPKVPDRWLITRKNGMDTKQWVVESNFLQPEGKNNTENSITFPLNPHERGPEGQPFRYMGRQYDFLGTFAKPGDDYFDNLTALGYGEPSFGAMYAECHSVFGCHDVFEKKLTGKIEYEVIGWYNNTDDDYLNKFVDDILQREDINALASSKKNAAVTDAIKAAFRIGFEDGVSFPEKLICYGRLVFEENALKNCSETVPEIKEVSFGNTGTEALSALLSSGNIKIEKQLEAIRLRSRIGNKRLDIHAKFEEAFHENGFTPVEGGTLWGIEKETSKNSQPVVQNKQVEVSLPDNFAHKINQLNELQQKFKHALDEFRDLKQQLFSDWYKFMMIEHHPYIHPDELGDIDEIRFFIENSNFNELKNKEKELEILSPGKEHNGAIWNALKEVKSALTNFNTAFIARGTQVFGNQNEPLHYIFTENKTQFPNLQLGTPMLWGKCLPFNTSCLQFSGQASKMLLNLNNIPDPLPAELLAQNALLENLKTMKAISLWVKIEASKVSAYFNLLRIEGINNSSIGSEGIGDFWTTIKVNGTQLNLTSNYAWSQIQKGVWVHIYLEAKESFMEDITFMENCTENEVTASLASIRIMKKGLSEDEQANDRNIFGQTQFKLTETAAPRYWQPNEPVVLLSGPACEPSPRHGFDGKNTDDNRLKCTYSDSDFPINNQTLQQLVRDEAVQQFYNTEMANYLKWNQPWNPLVFEWEVEIFPFVKQNPSFSESDILNRFQLNITSPDLKLKSDHPDFTDGGKIFTGSTLLSPHAKLKLLDSIKNFLWNLKNEDLQNFGELPVKPDHSRDTVEDYSPTALAIKETEKVAYINKLVPLLVNFKEGPIKNAAAHWNTLNEGHYLSQSLGGFNAAMLMHKQTLQLPIDDPLGFKDDQLFNQQVKEWVGLENKWAPEPLNPFLPIRSGKIKLLNLQLIDSFGRHVTLKPKGKLAHSHAFPQVLGGALLPPRLPQASRLNLRWLSANHDTDLEMNSHPASSPICGWLLPNNLDGNIMVYNQAGFLLGLIHHSGAWLPGPGNEIHLDIEEIQNKHVRKVIKSLQKDSEHFIGLFDQTLEKIDPESFSQHLDLALLMSRPIAIVRASLNLELKGRTAVTQSWDRLTRKVQNDDYDTEGFDTVKFPVRLGEPGQFNDGVLGYWKEEPDEDIFYSSLLSKYGSPKENTYINYYNPAKPSISISIQDAPQTFTMLIDPRAKVHLVSGILPVKVIEIPPDQYRLALSRMDITFFTAPILSPSGTLALNLPVEAGYEWSWISKKEATWSEISQSGTIDKHKVEATFQNGLAIWNELIANKWLDPIDGFTARIVQKDERKKEAKSKILSLEKDRIEQLLNKCKIVAPDTSATFRGNSEINEGWLKLSHTEKFKK
jgi:hypothetical protein